MLRPAFQFSTVFAVPGFLLASGIVCAAWVMAPDLLPLQGQSWGDAAYPFTAAAFSALIARVCFTVFSGKVKGRTGGALLGAVIALLSFYVTCTHAGAALLYHKGYELWWLDAWGAGFWSYMIWSFFGLWGFGVPLLGAVVGGRTYKLLVEQHSDDLLNADAHR
jgi:hypothetical protein